MKEDESYYYRGIKPVLPEIFLKVMDVKNLLESKKEENGTGCGEPCRHQPQCVL